MKKYLFLFFLCLTYTACALEPVIIVLGPPGAGKGSLSQFFKEHYQYQHLGAGDLVRQEVGRNTEIGQIIAETVKRGERIDPKIMRSLLLRALEVFQASGSPFLIDGFGGDQGDMEFLYGVLSQYGLLCRTFVIFLDARDETCKERMAERLLCSRCGQVYGAGETRPQEEGSCDLCKGELIKRNNDTPEVIDRRIQLYRKSVEPNYLQAVNFFPTIFHQTDGRVDTACAFYESVARNVFAFDGEAKDFVKHFLNCNMEQRHDSVK